MDWSSEQYVRLYTRDTTTWRLMGFDAQTVLMHLLRKVNRFGVIDTEGLEAWQVVVVNTTVPEHIARPGMARLLELRVMVEHGGALAFPKFVEAQTAARTPKQRAKDYRDRKAETAANVTIRDESSERVTSRDEASRIVTQRHDSSLSTLLCSTLLCSAEGERERSGEPPAASPSRPSAHGAAESSPPDPSAVERGEGKAAPEALRTPEGSGAKPSGRPGAPGGLFDEDTEGNEEPAESKPPAAPKPRAKRTKPAALVALEGALAAEAAKRGDVPPVLSRAVGPKAAFRVALDADRTGGDVAASAQRLAAVWYARGNGNVWKLHDLPFSGPAAPSRGAAPHAPASAFGRVANPFGDDEEE